MTTFRLPDLGEGLSEAEIVQWHVSVGDRVVADQPLVSVETDKAVVEIPSPSSGIVKALHGDPGTVIDIGEPLADIAAGVADDQGAVVGDLAGAEPLAPMSPPKPASESGLRAMAMPAVRALARTRGVDLAKVKGTGPGGTAVTADIERAAATQTAETGEPLRGVRRAMARTMTRAGESVVPATVTDSADIGDWRESEEPTIRLIRAVAEACSAEPALNARFDGTLRYENPNVDLAIAMDTRDGLFAPVLRGAQAQDRNQLQDRLASLKDAVRERSIAPEDLRGGTITLSNFGTIGGIHAALVVTPPQVAIVGAGRIGNQADVSDGTIRVRRKLPLSLTFDHRVVTGGEAARFLEALRLDLERPD